MTDATRRIASTASTLFVCAAIGLMGWGSYVSFKHLTDKHDHNGYMTAEALVVFDNSGSRGYRLSMIAKLADGQEVTADITRGNLASQTGDRVCLEERRHRSGRLSYLIAPM